MFYCIGENEVSSFMIGQGETLEQALSDWSSSKDIWNDIMDEFNRFAPTVIEGKELHVELVCPPPIIKIR